MTSGVLVIGGGIAGIEAALNLADLGERVYLLDDTPSIGGLMARLDKTFPTNDCSICIEAPKMYEVQTHPNITLLTNSIVRKVKGRAGRFKVTVVEKAKFVDEDKCKGCAKCVEACPVSLPDELDGKLGGIRKLIGLPFPQAVPNTYVVSPLCRFGHMDHKGACVGKCIIDCSQCRECQIAECVVACRKEGAEAVLLWQKDKRHKLRIKSIIVATGVEPYEPPADHYGYDRYDNVLTTMQFERLMNAGGPTEGDIIRLSDGRHPKRIGWIQCVGREVGLKEDSRGELMAGTREDSRENLKQRMEEGAAEGSNDHLAASQRGHLPYCSKVCCMFSTKQTIIAKEHDPDVEAYVFHHNLKDYGKGFHDFVRRAEAHGVNYVKGKPSDVFQDPETKGLTVRYEDLDTGDLHDLELDLLVLATGLLPGQRNEKLAKRLGVELNERGYFAERDPLFAPLESTVEGIYLCGGATGPIDISESVTQAIAASLKAAQWGGEAVG